MSNTAPNKEKPDLRRILSSLRPALFFPAAIYYHELLLRIFDRETPFGGPALLRILLFSASAGLLVFLILDLLPRRRTARIAGGAVLCLVAVLFCIERGCRTTFGLYYGITFMGHTARNAVSGFGGTILQSALQTLPFVVLSFAPLEAFYLLRNRVIREERQKRREQMILVAAIFVCHITGWALSAFGSAGSYYTYAFTPNTGIPCFGVISSVRLELAYRITGIPAPPLDAWADAAAAVPAVGPDGPGGSSAAAPGTGSDAPEEGLAAPGKGSDRSEGGSATDEGPAAPVAGSQENAESAAAMPGAYRGGPGENPAAGTGTGPSGTAGTSAAGSTAPDDPRPPFSTEPNKLDIDFAALAESEPGRTIQSMHQYFGSLTPSAKNEYTGLFEGKNLILITAESFSPPAVDEALTPTLYKLTHEGFVFHNFYQPDWTQSTCGGEFSVTTGLIPNWVNGGLAAQVCIGHQMPTTLASLFAPLGYNVPAWHNGIYTYYDRNRYLTGFGYTFAGCDGGGLVLPTNGFPRSDLEMIEATADSYINDYVENGVPFHAYYMTISGHGGYSWGGNAMSAKHREAVEARYPDLSPAAQAYLACNMELDLALECLVDKLTAAGIAEDTLIVMTGDHYPYMLASGNGADYYNELRGFEDTEYDTSRYRNALLMWSAGIQEPIDVDTPCSSIDIVPTLCNLFGLDYDSRLYSGRDIFAGNYEPDAFSDCMPLVVFADTRGRGSSWITAAGAYECSTGTFTPNEGITVDEAYVEQVHQLVAAKFTYSRLIVQHDYYKYVFSKSE